MATKKTDSTRFKYTDYTIIHMSQIQNPITVGPWLSKSISLIFLLLNFFISFLFQILVDNKGLMNTNLLSFTWWDMKDENIIADGKGD